ncbi:MAG: hypothetical protein ABFC30_08245, partial [Proteiniphilum sp.]
MNSKKIIISLIVVLSCLTCPLGGAERFITTQHDSNTMVLYEAGVTASILLYPNTDRGIQRAVSDLQNDYRKLTGHTPNLMNSFAPAKMPLIIIGTIGTHSAIDALIALKKFDASRLKGKREMFLIEHI